MDKIEYTIKPMTGVDSETGEQWKAWVSLDADGYISDVYDTWAQAIAGAIVEFNS